MAALLIVSKGTDIRVIVAIRLFALRERCKSDCVIVIDRVVLLRVWQTRRVQIGRHFVLQTVQILVVVREHLWQCWVLEGLGIAASEHVAVYRHSLADGESVSCWACLEQFLRDIVYAVFVVCDYLDHGAFWLQLLQTLVLKSWKGLEIGEDEVQGLEVYIL